MLDVHALCNDPDAYKAHLTRRAEDPSTFALVDQILEKNELRKTLTGERDELVGYYDADPADPPPDPASAPPTTPGGTQHA